MVHFSPQEISERDNYKFLIGSIIPRPIALITSVSKDEVLNIAPFSYFNIVTSNPPIVSVSLQRKDGVLKDTARNLLENKEAVIHVVDVENVDEANETAANLKADESELEQTNFTLEPSETVAIPSLKETKIRFEVELYKHVLVENKEEPAADLMLLKINHYHIDDALYHEGRIDPDGLGAVSRLAGHDYAEIGEIFTRVRPK
jgi:flavin reductase (DIM6/NTAB) family NADH-FMN oxidoreductase RutF